MSPTRRPQKPARHARPRPPTPVDLWQAKPEPPAPEPIAPAADPTVVLRSLGTPPLAGQAAVAEMRLAAVATQASHLAIALAAAADLLAEPAED